MRSIKAFIVFINIFTGIRSEDGQFGRLEKKNKGIMKFIKFYEEENRNQSI